MMRVQGGMGVGDGRVFRVVWVWVSTGVWNSQGVTEKRESRVETRQRG